MAVSLPQSFESEFEILLGFVGRQAFSNPSVENFVQWFQRAAPSLMPTLLEMMPPQPDGGAQFLRVAALSLYGQLPMPDHGLQPVSVPKPGRNDPCLCGSTQKYKHCCGAIAMPPLFGNVNLLRYVLDAYPKTRLGDVCTSRAGIDAVADTAFQWMDKGEDARASALVEPYFSGTGPLTARVAPLFNLLMDIWLQMGRPTKRDRLVEALLQRGDRTLKAEALQRRTSMLCDKGDYPGAWRAFKQATEFNPNDPALGVLEVTVLVSEGRMSEAKTRAQWWAASLAKRRDPELEDLVDRLRAMAQDPHGGMMDVAASANPDLQRLQDLFRAAPAPVVRHRFEVFMDEGHGGEAHPMASEFVPTAELAKLEKRWLKTFQQVKPDMTVVQHDVEEVWHNAPQWLDLLQQHPVLWSSFEVLDDLVMAVGTVHWAGVEERLLVPMAERAAEQLRLTLESGSSESVSCPWVVWSHRPCLRPIAQLALVCQEAGNWTRFMELAHWLVFELNPNDNHGLRTDLSCAYVKFERWSDVLALHNRYPGDMQPTLGLNAGLAAYALGNTEAARALILQAKDEYPVAVKMLLSASPKPVKPDGPYGIAIGGKYEAWLYVEAMQVFWSQHGALDWARETLGPAKRKTVTWPAVPKRLL